MNLVAVPCGAPFPSEPYIPFERVLCINLAHIGDVLHTVPMLRSLRAQQPAAKIDLMVGPWCYEVAKRIPYIDRVMVYSPAVMSYRRGDRRAPLSWWKEFLYLKCLRAASYDLVLCAPNPQYIERFLCHVLKPTLWGGAEWYTPLYARFSRDMTRPYTGWQYESSRMADLLSVVGLEPGTVDLEFPVDIADKKYVSALLARHGVCKGAYVVITPGAGWEGKQWPVEHFAELAEQLIDDLGIHTVLLTGSANEFDLCEKVCADNECIINISGQTSWSQLGAVLQDSMMWIGNDSGTMHVAAAVKVPTLSLFGPTRPEQWAPRGCGHRYLKGQRCGAECRPWHVAYACEQNKFCMRAITVDCVLNVVADMLRRMKLTDC